MFWDEAEATLRSWIETNWALGAYASLPLVFENEIEPQGVDSFMAVNMEGTTSDKTIYGSIGLRSSIEGGIIFFYSFVPIGSGKDKATKPVIAMTQMLELQTIAQYIHLDGGNPPSPTHHGISELDRLIPAPQPQGDYYRVAGSVPFIIRGVR